MKILDSHSALEVTLFEAAFSDPFMKLRNSMKSTAHLLTIEKCLRANFIQVGCPVESHNLKGRELNPNLPRPAWNFPRFDHLSTNQERYL